jgi:hypothetical protein
LLLKVKASAAVFPDPAELVHARPMC